MQGFFLLPMLVLYCTFLGANELNRSMDEKLGQSLLIGISGSHLSKTSKDKLLKIKPGGIILFGANIRDFHQTKKFTSDINKLFRDNNLISPFIGVDQEGGNVTRIKLSPVLPSPRLLGDIDHPELTREFAEVNAMLLSSLGFNLNFAPVLDLGAPYAEDFIGPRAYGHEWDKVLTHSRQFIYGANSAKVISTAKHFPGHGQLSEDSHKKLPVSQQTTKDLFENDLVPYVDLLKDKLLPAVMVGHISYPKIDPTGHPASFSKPIIQGILREKLGFKGLIFTDDILMKAASLTPHPGKRAKIALEAGVDMVMIAWSQPSQWSSFQYLRSQLKAKDFSQVVEDRYQRILNVKKQFGLLNPANTFDRKIASTRYLHKEWTSLYKKLVSEGGVALKQGSYLKSIKAKEESPSLIISRSKKAYFSFKEGNKNRRYLYFNLKNRSLKNLIEQLDKNYNQAPIYLFISSRKDFNDFLKLQKNLKERVFVISSSPSSSTNKEPIKFEFNTYTWIPELGNFLARNEKSIL